MRLVCWSLATSVLLSLIVFVRNQGHGQSGGPAKEVKFSHLFGFKSFKKLFEKKYHSPIEESNRAKIFSTNLLRSFLSKVAYKHNKCGAYLGINSMSDLTVEEFDEILIDPRVYLDGQLEGREESAKLDTLVQVNDYMDTDSLDQRAQDTKRPVGSRKQLTKMAAKNLASKWTSLSKLIQHKTNQAGHNVEGFLMRMFHSLPKQTDLPDEVFIDHRQSGCMTKVKHQRRCGSCYVFSTLALYEWAYCRLTGKQVRFSEQYVINCGRRVKMRGCNGGREPMVAGFVDKYGFETMNDIFYTGRDGICPYDQLNDDGEGDKLNIFLDGEAPREVGEESMGLYRMDKPKLIPIGLGGIEQQLRVSPVIIAVRTSGIFQHYGGGVDMGRGCEKKRSLHSMLIVGHGRQDGYEYWLIRNSFGSRWGEQGHWKLAKSNNCYTIGNSGLALGALDYRSAPNGIDFNSTIPLVELQRSGHPQVAVVYNFTENPKHNRKFVYNAVSRIMHKTRANLRVS